MAHINAERERFVVYYPPDYKNLANFQEKDNILNASYIKKNEFT